MYLAVLLFISYFSSILFSALSDNKKIYIYSITFSHICFLIMGCFYFYLLKYNAQNLLTFPDERLYVYDYDSKLLFANYTQIISNLLGIEFVRVFNIFIFSATIGLLISCVYNKVSHNYTFILLATLAIFAGSYWSFFVLKESFTISALSLMILSKFKNSKVLLYFSLVLLYLARPDLFVLYLACGFLVYLKSKNKYIYYSFVIFSIIIIVAFFYSKYSIPLKLFTLSRRFGEGNFEFDDVAISTSSLGLISYLFSEPLRQAILTNISSSFNFFYDFNILVALHKVLNVLVLFLFIKVLKRIRLLTDNFLVFLLVSLVGLIFTHSVYRYMNVIFIPMSFYLFYLLYYNNRNSNGKG